MSLTEQEQRTWKIVTPDGDIGVLTYDPLDLNEIEKLVISPKAGAVVTFTGYTRDSFEDKTVTHLEYETYPTLALKTLSSILSRARELPIPEPSVAHPGCHHPSTTLDSNSNQTSSPTELNATSNPSPNPSLRRRISLIRITAHHLLGPSPVETPSIVISVSSPHRKEAFQVCEWVLEKVKLEVQIWKREFYATPSDRKESGSGRENGAEDSKEGKEMFMGGDGEGKKKVVGREWEWKQNFPLPNTFEKGK